ncbi:MAG TPA: PmoA family protein [Lacipirellulaceae bacterium]|nr:PmoA family protein [Lacipirellulaceae bacterium]
MSRIHRLVRTSAILMSLFSAAVEYLPAEETDRAPIEFVKRDGQITVAIDRLPVAVYFYNDAKILRPYFADVRARDGLQVTRHHPPVEGQDVMDHPTFHPGIWMAFGDINGSDYWRLKARVRHAGFVEEPKCESGKASFAVHNQYLDQKDPSKVVCDETARYTFVNRPEGYFLLWDSTFSSVHRFAFGDQEEMGLGFRVATALRVEKKSKDNAAAGNGTILDSEGRKDGREIWGNSADWCDYSGTMARQRVGITIFCHPDNFRPSWFHARDYGLLEANPFGRHAFGKGATSSVVVKPGEKLRLRYGILVHSGPEKSKTDYAAAFRDYQRLAGK